MNSPIHLKLRLIGPHALQRTLAEPHEGIPRLDLTGRLALPLAALLEQSVDQIRGLDQPVVLLVVFGAVLTFLSLCGFMGACCAIQRDGHTKIDGCCADRALMIYYVGILTGKFPLLSQRNP